MSMHAAISKSLPKSTSDSDSRPSSQEATARTSSRSSKAHVAKRSQPEEPATKGKRSRPVETDAGAASATGKPAREKRSRIAADEASTKPTARTVAAETNGTEKKRKISVRKAAISLQEELDRFKQTNVPSTDDIAKGMRKLWWETQKLTEDAEVDLLSVRAIRTMHTELPSLAKQSLAKHARLPTPDETKWFATAQVDFQDVFRYSSSIVEKRRRQLEEAERDHALVESASKSLVDVAESRGRLPDGERLCDEAVVAMQQYQVELAAKAGVTLTHLGQQPQPQPQVPAPANACPDHLTETSIKCSGCPAIICPACFPPRSDPNVPHLYKWDCPKCNRPDIGVKQILVRAAQQPEAMDVAPAAAAATTTTTTSTATTVPRTPLPPVPDRLQESDFGDLMLANDPGQAHLDMFFGEQPGLEYEQ